MSASYLELRRQLTARDRSLHEKVVSLDEAASLVKDGETLGIGGSTLSRTVGSSPCAPLEKIGWCP